MPTNRRENTASVGRNPCVKKPSLPAGVSGICSASTLPGHANSPASLPRATSLDRQMEQVRTAQRAEPSIVTRRAARAHELVDRVRAFRRQPVGVRLVDSSPSARPRSSSRADTSGSTSTSTKSACRRARAQRTDPRRTHRRLRRRARAAGRVRARARSRPREGLDPRGVLRRAVAGRRARDRRVRARGRHARDDGRLGALGPSTCSICRSRDVARGKDAGEFACPGSVLAAIPETPAGKLGFFTQGLRPDARGVFSPVGWISR